MISGSALFDITIKAKEKNQQEDKEWAEKEILELEEDLIAAARKGLFHWSFDYKASISYDKINSLATLLKKFGYEATRTGRT